MNETQPSAYLLVGAHVGHGLLLGLPLALVAVILEPDLDLNEGYYSLLLLEPQLGDLNDEPSEKV